MATNTLIRFLPRSMGLLIATGYLVAAIPLIVAIILAANALNRLSGHSESLLRDGVLAARLGVRLRDEYIDLERSARQYVAIGNAELLDLFNQRLLQANQTLSEIATQNPGDAFDPLLPQMRESTNEVARQWSIALKTGSELANTIDAISALSAQAAVMIELSDKATDREIASLRDATQRAQGIILVAVGALIPLTILLSLAFTSVIVRPLRRAERGIAALGHAQYTSPIQIDYPHEMSELGDRLDWLRRRLAQLESDKDRFLSHVTHELKTPLASLREGTSLLRDQALGPLTEQQAEVAGILDESARELEDMVINLLTYAEWRREREHTSANWFEVGQLLADIAGSRRLLLAARNIRLEYSDADTTLWGQAARIREVLDNLIGNAIKHAPQQSAIVISARVQEDHCELSVRDYGQGIPEALASTLFEPFVRGDVVEESAVRGTGIGLSIVRETIMEHGGTVEVENAEPGARFFLRWPCPADSRQQRLRDDAGEKASTNGLPGPGDEHRPAGSNGAMAGPAPDN